MEMTENKLEIRNLGTQHGKIKYRDCDIVAFHAVFTCLCNWVEHDVPAWNHEEDHDDIEKHFQIYINTQTDPKHWPDYKQEELNKRKKELEACWDLYKWYNDTDWESVYDYYYHNEDQPPYQKLKQAVEIMGHWWI